jgi:hypothetical protein
MNDILMLSNPSFCLIELYHQFLFADLHFKDDEDDIIYETEVIHN